MEERRPETSFDALGAPWVNGGSLPVGQICNVPGQRRESPEESADADRESIETSSEPPAEPNNLATGASHLPGSATLRYCAPDAPRSVSRSPCSAFLKSAHRSQASSGSTAAKGNLIVSQGRSAFVGSGQNVVHDRIIVNVARGKKGKGGKRQPPVPFSTLQLHGALEKALKNMDFPELRVGQQLHVNGEHVAADPRLLPEALGPPVADAPSGLLDEGCIHPTPEARTYVCAEISGWKGQLVVSLFTRAVQVHGSLQVEWMFYVLPPLNTNLLLIDQQYEPHRIKQVTKAIGSGIRHFVPDLLSAPVTFTQYAVRPVVDWFRIRSQSYRIRNGHVFNYGSPPSIRENAISHRRQHDFVIGDERTFILLARHTMLRALRKFLKAHKIDMKQFSDQEKLIGNITPAVAGVTALANAIDAVRTAVSHL